MSSVHGDPPSGVSAPESDPRPSTNGRKSRSPSMLDLIRLSPNDVRPPGGRSIYRQIALLADLNRRTAEDDSPPREVLDAPCGAGLQLAYLVGEFGVHGSGVDSDVRLVERANTRAREMGVEGQLHFQDAPLDALPYRDAIFDLTVGELGLVSDVEPEAAVNELVRVTKPGGTVVLLQLVWKAPLPEGRRQKLVEHLGTRPLMLVEWKRLLKEAGVHEVHSSEWSDEEQPLRPTGAKPFPDFNQRFSFGERISILRKAWGLWGWRGLRDTLAREAEVHRLLTRERILGFVLLKGTRALSDAQGADAKAPPASSGKGDLPLFRAPGTADPPRAAPDPAPESDEAPPKSADKAADAAPAEAEPALKPTKTPAAPTDVADLPLFGSSDAPTGNEG